METQSTKTAAFSPPGCGPSTRMLGAAHRLVLAPAQTGGSLFLAEVVVNPGGGPPLHTHSREDEIFYVLEGELDLQLGDRSYRAEPGTLAYLPRGIAHRFGNSTEQPTRFLTLVTPPEFLGYFEKLSALTQQPGFQLSDILPLADSYGIEMRPDRVQTLLGPNEFGQTGRISGPGEGLETCYRGGHVTVKLASADTGGQLSVIEAVIPPGGGPPTHYHKGFEEIFFVQEGEFLFQAEDRVYSATPGSAVCFPRHLIHQFCNNSDTPGRLLTFLAPAGFEQWFARIGALEASGRATPEAMISLGQELDTHILF